MTDRRLMDDGTSVLASPIDEADAVLPLSDAQWTTASATYPLRLRVGGELMVATGIVTNGTQTFTGVARGVNGIRKAHPAGTPVRVADGQRLTMGHALSPETPVTGAPPPPPTPEPTPEVPTDGLQLWIDAGEDPTAGDLAGQGFTAELGSTSGSDAQDPAVTVAGSVDVWTPDGVDDHIDTDYTPSFTPTSGAATFVFIGVYDDTDAAENFQRALSTESASGDGINISFGGAGDAELWTTVGGATTLAVKFFIAGDGLALVDGQRFMVACTISAGALRLYEPGQGLSAAVDATGIGAITHGPLRFFRPSADGVADRACSSSMQAGLAYNRALTGTELDSIAAAYGLLGGEGGGGNPGQFRTQQSLAVPGEPPHVLTALGYTDSAPITRAQLDGILDDWVTGTGGTTRTATSVATFHSACAAAVPGDLIRVTADIDGVVNARGDLYGIAGATFTTSPDGGDPGNPIIVTCADGVWLDDQQPTNVEGAIDFSNVRHVWGVGLNVRNSQFGIRCLNWGGSAGNPAYLAYCRANTIRDASIPVQGWFQTIAASGGTPPAGDGNEYGFSEHFVIEECDVFDPNPGDVTGNPGEGVYLGKGAPAWYGPARDGWVRGNRVDRAKANAFEAKPACRRIRFHDNVAVRNRGQLGAPFELCYHGTVRPAFFAGIDPEIYCEANRIYDFNITETGASRNQVILVGLAGCRVANNIYWSGRNAAGLSGPGDNFYGVLVFTEATAASFGDATTIPTWVVNNLFWSRGILNQGASDASSIPGIDARNNIVPSGYSDGTHTATSGDFVGPVPAVGALSTADAGLGPGSGWQLDPDSDLIGDGDSISDLALAIDADVLGRPIPTSSPNPGPFQSA